MASECVKVVVRCRPMNNRERELKCQAVVSMDSSRGQCFIRRPEGAEETPKQFTFDGAYYVEHCTEQIYNEIAFPLVEMFRMSTGHMEGDLQLLYVLLTDCYIYLLRKGAADKPYMVEDAVSYNELDYVSVGLDQQAVTLVCTNRRRQFLVDTADLSLTEIFISALKSAMINGCREPPYPGVLTDATMERLALAKFVSQESKIEASDVVMLYYGLVHWEDPCDEAVGCSVPNSSSRDQAKEGVLHYKASTSYLGRETWRSCYVVLSNGILYQYPERTDVVPLLSINLGGEQCGGCRRANTTDRAHSFQVILTDQPSLELSAANEEDMADWMLHLCQAVSKGVTPLGDVPSPCIPCCLVQSGDRLITCHQDCQTSFFRALGVTDLLDLSCVSSVEGREYCALEFTQERSRVLLPWILYFSCRQELERFLSSLRAAWKAIYQVDLPHKVIPEPLVKKCEDALSLIHSTWQRSDSLCRGRSSRDPWC
ncbi:pleckstrin homology domain-containing family M member 2 [Anomaloglossus baeobatrachus]|uniref:pleckstrin homology domain-containing family M member 2 n=1 Tax=Anomaloglossus baeobatrachus TaxID=238106 RepID=UPI003F4FA734